MQYNTTIHINPYDYADKDAMIDSIMTSLEKYHPSVGDSSDFLNLLDIVVTIDAEFLNEATAKAINLVNKVGAVVGIEVIPTNL